MPPIPETITGHWLPIGEYGLATRKLPAAIYDIQLLFKQATEENPDDYVAAGFDGHGVNSWAAHFHVVNPKLALFLQCGWGNALEDAGRARERIDGAFGMARALLQSIDDAAQRGAWPSGQRLLLRMSDFYGSGWGWADDPDGWRNDGDLSLLSAISAVRRLPSRTGSQAVERR